MSAPVQVSVRTRPSSGPVLYEAMCSGPHDHRRGGRYPMMATLRKEIAVGFAVIHLSRLHNIEVLPSEIAIDGEVPA